MKKWQLFALVSGLILILLPLTVLAMGGTVPGPNRQPVANAGWDQTGEANNMVFLDGSGSFDPEESMLTYQWELLAVPQGATARLTGERGMTTCCFSPDAVGVWIICLTVCDGELVSERDVMQVRVKEPPPTPTKPDFKITDIRAFGIYEGKYFKKFSNIKNDI